MKPILKIFSLIVILSTMFMVQAQARPVSYPGGWTVMQMNDGDTYSLHVHYSPTAEYSLGYRTAYWQNEGYQTHSMQLNNLIKRWNGADSQANIYLKSGIGIAYDSSGDISPDVEPHAFTGIALDWENRRFFTGYDNSYHYAGEINDEFSQSVKVGVAPYIGEYGDLHTWIMLKVDHHPEDDDPLTVTTLLRFFKGAYMLEIGLSDDKDILANMIIRF